MLLALEFTDDVDPTALATVALALATLGTLLLLMRSLVYTRRALAQTREDVELSRREVEEAHRPVIVPVIDATRKLRPDRPDLRQRCRRSCRAASSGSLSRTSAPGLP